MPDTPRETLRNTALADAAQTRRRIADGDCGSLVYSYSDIVDAIDSAIRSGIPADLAVRLEKQKGELRAASLALSGRAPARFDDESALCDIPAVEDAAGDLARCLETIAHLAGDPLAAVSAGGDVLTLAVGRNGALLNGVLVCPPDATRQVAVLAALAESIGKPKTLLPRSSEPARVNSLQLMRYWGPLPV
jgi:hypothetical protein